MNYTNIAWQLNIRNDGKELGKKLKAIGDLLSYHGSVLDGQIDDSFQVMDEEAGKLVTDFSNLKGTSRNGVPEYEHQN